MSSRSAAWLLALATSLSAIATSTVAQSGGATLVGPYWKVIELDGKPVPAQDAKREAHLIFQPANRVSGSDGCNQFTGSYDLKGEGIAFGQLARTQMACLNIGDIDRTFQAALKNAKRLTAVTDRLQLFDAAGARVAVFAARTPTQPDTAD